MISFGILIFIVYSFIFFFFNVDITLIYQQAGFKYYDNGIIPTLKKYIRETNYFSILNGSFPLFLKGYVEFFSRIQFMSLYDRFYPEEEVLEIEAVHPFWRSCIFQWAPILLTFPFDFGYIRSKQYFRDKNGILTSFARSFKDEGFLFYFKGLLFEIIHKVLMTLLTHTLNPYICRILKKLSFTPAFSKLVNNFVCSTILYPLDTVKIRYLTSTISPKIPYELQSIYDRKKSLIQNILYFPITKYYDGYLTYMYYYFGRIISTRIFSFIFINIKRYYDSSKEKQRSSEKIIHNIVKDISGKRHLWSTQYSRPSVYHDKKFDHF